MRLGLTGRMLVASGALALTVAAAFTVVVLEIRNQHEASLLAQRAEEVTAAANELEGLVIDLQTGSRGFVITRDERFLDPWENARARIPAQARELERLIIDGEQRARVREVVDDIRAYDEQFATPLIATARTDRALAIEMVKSSEGKRRVDGIRADFRRFDETQRRLAAERQARAKAKLERATAVGLAGLAGSVLLIFLFAGYLNRAIVVPIRRVAGGAHRLASGDLATRVPERGKTEVGELGRAFNAMAATLEESRDELESQNVELEHQQVELEEQQTRLVAANEALERQVAINRVVLDATPAGIVLLDREGRRVVTNSALGRFAPEDVGDQDLRTRIAASAERAVDPEGFRTRLEAILTDPECETTERIDLADGGRIELYTAPVSGADGEFIGRIVTVRDISAEQEAERMKSELVATVSHELRTPLASILGFSELLVTRDLDTATRERYLQTIYKEASRLTALINDFLDLQKMEVGGFTLDLEPFDLREVLRHQVELFSGQSAAHTVELAEPTEPILVAGDRDRLEQVVGNLLSNAIKYSPAGGPVGVRVDQSDGAVRVSVSDRGLGIPTEQQAQIFTKFFRVDSSDTRKIGGTGLGLALTREIVEAHRGRIGFKSVEGDGTTFWFELPAGPRPTGRPLDDGRPRALVVEDDLSAATLLSEQLQEEGFAVDVAATGSEALERVQARPPELVCLDIRLEADFDGWQVLAELKARPETAHVPVVVVTAYNGREKAAALGAADFITKPFTADRLREAVKRVLPIGGRSVLVVDDEENVRRLVLETLGDNGLDLREAADGEEALVSIAKHKPDAIVLDLLMPNLDGFSVLERLQEDPAWRSIPVIVLTAHRLSAAERRSLRKRTLSLIEKSAYSGAELRRQIDRALAGRRTD